jgi:hypothetical protein
MDLAGGCVEKLDLRVFRIAGKRRDGLDEGDLFAVRSPVDRRSSAR